MDNGHWSSSASFRSWHPLLRDPRSRFLATVFYLLVSSGLVTGPELQDLVLVLGRNLVLVLGQVMNWFPCSSRRSWLQDPGEVPLDIYPMKSYI